MSLFSDFKKNKKQVGGDPFSIQEGKLRLGNLVSSSSFKMHWMEDSFISDNRNHEVVGKNFQYAKLYIFSLVIAFFLLILFSRAAWLQVVRGEHYYSVAEGNRIRVERIEPKRGVIYDRNYRPLVRNVANFLLYLMPVDLPREPEERDLLVARVCQLVGKDCSEIFNTLNGIERGSESFYEPLFVDDNIDYESAIKVYLESSGMPGVVLTNKTRREYNSYGLTLSHVLGYTGKINQKELEKSGDEYRFIDYIGKSGIEHFWESELRGVSGKKQIEVDAIGKEKRIISSTDAQDGHNLVLTIDVVVQRKIEDIIIEHLSAINKSKAVVVVMNPINGEIISMVSFPAYNNNFFARGITQEEYSGLINREDNPLFNRAIKGEYPSGSTFKMVVASAALEEGLITERTAYNSTGGIGISSWYFPDWLAGGHGLTNVKQAIANSVNTFFYYIGGGYNDIKGLGVERIVEYGKLFGFGAQTGIDLSGENSGLLPTPEWKKEYKNERWYIGDTYHLAIGQGDLLATPLQVANFTSVFANGGKLYRPHVVKQILTSEDRIIGEPIITPVREDFISKYNLGVVRDGMKQTVTYGSATMLQGVSVEVAGKTGTAQWSSKGEPHAWFTGFAPFNQPEIVITVLVEEGGEGSRVATPIARDFLKWYFSEYKNEIDTQ